MKVLELVPYVFIEGHPYGQRNRSGLAYMIRSVCDMLAKHNEVRVLSQSILTDEQKVEGWVLVRRNFWTITSHLKWRYLRLAFQLKGKLGNFPRLLLYCLSAGQVEHYIHRWKPDVIHIHGIGAYTMPYYLAAARCGISVVSTLHGLLSFHSIVPASESAKKTERLILDMCIQNGYSVTFISSGMKNKVKEWSGNECVNITVIPNCFRPVEFDETHKIDDNVKRIVCVGSVYPLKNQIQVIRVLPQVQKMIGGKVALDIIGDGEKMEEWKRYTEENNIQGVTFRGRLPQSDVFNSVASADLLVFPSIEEGFGIPIIEAYSCGTPVVTFSDLDASFDIKNDDCCIFAKDRSDTALVTAIVDALERKWDRHKIKLYAQNFSMEETANKYSNVMRLNHKSWDVNVVEKLIKNI